MMSEYLMKHYQYLENISFEDLMINNIQWDVYRIPVTYKDALQAVNPPLNAEELAAEISSDKKVKKHYYSYDDPEYELPINAEVNNVVKRRFEDIHYKMFSALRKYNSLDSYDFYNERDEKEKAATKLSQKYAIWNNPSSTFDKFTPAEDIKKKVRARKAEN